MDEQRPTTRPDDTAEHELPDAKPLVIAVPPPPPRRKLPPKPPPPPPPRREQDTDQQAAPTAAEEKTQVAVAASVVVGESHTDEMARPGLLLGDPGTRPHLGMAAAQLRDLCEAQLSVESDVEREAQLHHALGRLSEGPLSDPEGAARHYGEVIGRAPDHVPALRGARRVAAQLGRHAELPALFDAELAVTRDPAAKARLLHAKGRVLEARLGRPADAIEVYREGLALAPGDLVLLKALERGYRRDESWAELADTYARLADAVDDPPLRAAWTALRAHLTEAKLGDPVQAATLYESALATDPHASDALAHVKRLGASQRRWPQLVAALRTEHELCRDVDARQSILRAIARVQERALGDAAAAIQTLEEALRARPEDTSLLRELARLAAATGRHPLRADALARRIELETAPEVVVGLAMELGQLHEGPLEAVEPALGWYERALAADPRHRGAAAALERLLTEREAWSEVRRVMATRAAALTDPIEQAQLHHRLGQLHERRLHDPDEATRQHARALSLDRSHHGAFVSLTRLLTHAGRWHELVELYERAIDHAPHDDEAIAWLFRMGAILEDRLDDPAAALSVYERVLERDAAHLGAWHAVQRAAERAGRIDRLSAALRSEAALTRDGERRDALLHRAAEHEAEADPDAACRALEGILTRTPAHRPSLETLARLRDASGHHAALVKVYERLLPIAAPDERARLHTRIAETRERALADDAGAIAAYRQALALEDRATVRDALARALERTGRWEELAACRREQLDRLEEPAERAAAAHALGVLLEEKLSDPARALEAHELALRADPLFRPALDARERLLTDAQAWERLAEAIAAEADASSDGFERTQASLRKALVLAHRGAPIHSALESFRPVFAAKSGHAGALVAVEGIYGKASDPAGLDATYARMADVLGAEPAVHAALEALAEARTERGEDVADLLGRMLEARPEDRGALERLAEDAERRGDATALLHAHSRLAALAQTAKVGAHHQARVGALLLARGDASAALAAYRAAVALDPSSLDAVRGLTLAARAVPDGGAMVQAARMERDATRDEVVAVQVLLEAARLFFDAGDEETAASTYEEALHLDPDSPEAATGLMATMMSATHVPRLIELLTLAASRADDPSRACILHLSVALLWSDVRGDLPAAIAATRRALAVVPRSQRAMATLARYLEENAQHADAAKVLESALEDATGKPRVDAHLSLAQLHERHLDRPEDAKAHLRRVLELEADHPGALTSLVRLERLTGHADEALALARRLIEVVQEPVPRAAALAEMAQLEKQRGDLAAAAAAAESAIAIQGPRAPAAKLYRGLIAQAPEQASWERYSQALMVYLERAKTQRGDLAATYRELARVFGEKHDRPERAIGVLREGVRACPYDASISLALVRALRNGREDGQAIDELRRLLDEDVLEVGAWRTLAEVIAGTSEPEGRAAVLSPLVTLGQATPEETQAVGARRVRAGKAPAGLLGHGGLEQLMDSPALHDAAATFLPAIGEILTKLEGVEYERWRVSKRDRIRTGEPHALRSFADRVARIFGAPEFDLFVSPAQLSRTFLVSGSPPALVVPSAIEGERDAVLAFHLARPLALLSRQLHALDHVDDRTLGHIICATVRQFEPGFVLHPLLEEEDIEAESRRVAKAIGFFSRGRLQDAALAYAAQPTPDIFMWSREIRRLATRAALLVADDLVAVLGTIGEELGPDNYATDLARFWVSDPAFRFRRALAQRAASTPTPT
ncbi:MAG: tetratricopeptide repeat protein [Myxococcota bacterium]|nr:tetratricopeptide repeat protein [Myxococcota bacterium]